MSKRLWVNWRAAGFQVRIILAVAILAGATLAFAWPVSGQTPDEGAPAQPTGLSGAVSSEAVSLSWDDPGDATITGYQVLRRNPAVDAKGVFQTVTDDTGSADTSYADTTVAAETRYFYRVAARNSWGLSPTSGFFRANVPAGDPDGTRADAIDLGDITDQDDKIFRRDSVDGTSDRMDYYKFTLNVTREVGLGLRNQDANGDLFLEDSGGNQLFSSENGGSADEWILENLSAGTYYIRVEAQDTGTNQYGLRYGVKPAVQQQGTPANSAASGQPAITGTAEVGETLTADTSGVTDGNGLSSVQYAHQWIRTSGGTDTDISGTTGSTYTLTDDDLGKGIKVRVSFTDDDGYSETLTSNATGAVSQPPNQPATGQPTITGTAEMGETLTADTSGITDGNGLSSVQYAYQWIRSTGGADTDISGATGSTYILTDDELAHTVKVRVSFTDDDGYSETLTSNATGAVNRPPNQPATGQPAITGTAEVGETLTADTSGITDGNGLSSVQYTHQWIRSSGGTDTDISGATGSSYTITSTDSGKSVKVRVSFTDDDGHSETLTSQATDVVLVTQQQQQGPTQDVDATGVLTITGTLQLGETLTMDTTGIADENGMSNVDFWYGWASVDGRIESWKYYNNKPTYTLVLEDLGSTIIAEVAFTDDGGYGERVTSAQTVVVTQPPNQDPSGLPAITGGTEDEKTLFTDTSAITDGNGLSNRKFRYQWIRNSGGTDTNIPGATHCAYLPGSDDLNNKVRVRVRFTDDHDFTETVTSDLTDEITEVQDPRPTNVSEPDGEDFPGNTCSTGVVAMGDSVTGNISKGRDVDWFKVDLTAEYFYQFNLKGESQDGGTLESPEIRGLAVRDGGYITHLRCNGGGGCNGPLRWRATKTESVFVGAGSWQRTKGTYTLNPTLIAAEDVVPADTTTTAEVDVGGHLLYVVQTDGDEDWIKVELEEDKRYRVEIVNKYTTGQKMPQYPALVNIRDPQGDVIPNTSFVYEHHVGEDFRHMQNSLSKSYRATETGTHYIVGGASGGTMGMFTLSVSEIGN